MDRMMSLEGLGQIFKNYFNSKNSTFYFPVNSRIEVI